MTIIDNGDGTSTLHTSLPVAYNALGQPSPNRTDFSGWTRKGLELFARNVADENLVLRADNEALHEMLRKEILKNG